MSQPMPPTAIDWTNFFNVAGYTADIAVAITIGAMILFVIIYRKRRKEKHEFRPQRGLHISRARDVTIFASISITILFTLSILSFTLAPNARFLPNNPSTQIFVTAYQWGFSFTYSNGYTSVGELNVPANATILFNVTSLDVMHNFYLPEFRVSIDAIPGLYNAIWVATPDVSGNSTINYQVLCKELCGVGHTFMFARMTVMSQEAFNQFLTNKTTIPSGG